MLISLVKSRQFSVAGRCIAIFFASVALHGCASGPDFSRMAPSNWPGAKQVAGTGRAIGGWVAKKAKLRPEEPRLPKSVVARRDPGPVVPGGQSSGNLRSFFTVENDSEPTDPFLAQLTQNQPAVESVSHTNPTPGADGAGNTEREPAFKPAAHSFDGPQETEPQPRIPIVDEGAPFRDLAGTDPTRRAANNVQTENPRFAAGIDQQLEQLREQTEVPQASAESLEEDNPLRSAILGATDDVSSEKIVNLPSETELPIADDFATEELPLRVAERAVPEAESVIDNILPEWARGELPSSKESEPMVAVDEVPLVKEEPIEPTPEEPTSPFNPLPSEDTIRVAVVEDEPTPEPVAEPTPTVEVPVETAPKAIEIVPFQSNSVVDIASFAEGDVSDQVEMLPPPPESVPDFGSDGNRDDAVGFGDDMPSFSGMIVESDDLPLGFAEWEGSDSTATLRTNSPIEAESASVVRRGEVTARLAVNSSHALVESSSNGDDELMGSESNGAQQRLLHDESDDNPFADDLSSEPRLFAPTEGGVKVAESSLEAIEWDPETEPGVEAESPFFSSTAIVGLLIGLVCLIGLGTIRRIQSAV